MFSNFKRQDKLVNKSGKLAKVKISTILLNNRLNILKNKMVLQNIVDK